MRKGTSWRPRQTTSVVQGFQKISYEANLFVPASLYSYMLSVWKCEPYSVCRFFCGICLNGFGTPLSLFGRHMWAAPSLSRSLILQGKVTMCCSCALMFLPKQLAVLCTSKCGETSCFVSSIWIAFPPQFDIGGMLVCKIHRSISAIAFYSGRCQHPASVAETSWLSAVTVRFCFQKTIKPTNSFGSSSKPH